MSWFLFVIVLFATARLTRIITTDYVTERPRLWVLRHVKRHGMIAYLIQCPACVSVWVGLALAVLAVAYPTNRALWAIFLGLTASMAAILVARLHEE